MRVEWSPHAVSDLKAISEYIEHDRSLATANRITRAIYDAIQTLKAMPYTGRLGRLAGTRELVVSRLPYLVVYRVFDQHLLVLNILHGRQRWP